MKAGSGKAWVKIIYYLSINIDIYARGQRNKNETNQKRCNELISVAPEIYFFFQFHPYKMQVNDL